MDSGESGDFSASDALSGSGFEDSKDDHSKKGKEHKLQNQPFDEALELSADADLSVAGSVKEKKLRNDKYDEALEVSASMDQSPMSGKSTRKPSTGKGSSKGEEKRDSVTGTPPRPQTGGSSAKAGPVTNKPFDEAYDLSQSDSDESVKTDKGKGGGAPKASATTKTTSGTTMSGGGKAAGGGPATARSSLQSPSHAPDTTPRGSGMPVKGSTTASQASGVGKTQKAASPTRSKGKGKGGPRSESESDSHSDDDEHTGLKIEGSYNPKEYAHLQVSQEVRDLFLYIQRYKPHEVELDTQLKCFIPDYLPAVGEMDSFLKVPRPDHQSDDLGLKVLDEPAASQSDATVLELQLRAMSKKTHGGDVTVRSIENAAKHPAEIDRWINSINELHRSKPPPQVHYKKAMPDIEQLMDVWPEEFEEALAKMPLPSVDIALSLEDYVRVVCAILDIPVYEGCMVESLHVLFTLYLEFKNNQHFMAVQQPQSALGGSDGFNSFK